MSKLNRAGYLSVIGLVLLAMAISSRISGQPKGNWSETPANITSGEFLDWYYWSGLHTEDNTAYTQFCPSSSPSTAILSITHSNDVKGEVNADARRMIRRYSAVLQSIFTSISKRQIVKKRW